jgi:hypothetical protein
MVARQILGNRGAQVLIHVDSLGIRRVIVFVQDATHRGPQ